MVYGMTASARTFVQQEQHAGLTCLPQMGQAANALPATVLPDRPPGSLLPRFLVRAGFSMHTYTQRQWIYVDCSTRIVVRSSLIMKLSKKLQDRLYPVTHSSEPALSLARHGRLEQRPVSDCTRWLYHIRPYSRLRGHDLRR